jgi:nucleoside 2-deoxyribosyltransferase
MTNPRVYLAGPDVFHPDHRRIFSERALICRHYGLEPLIPTDNEATTAPEIYRVNVQMLDACDAVIANITPFRGPHCDVGTAWEIGYAVARGKLVFAFSEVLEPLTTRIGQREEHVGVDATGMSIENFGLPENLMIVKGLTDREVHPSFEVAIEKLARRLLCG